VGEKDPTNRGGDGMSGLEGENRLERIKRHPYFFPVLWAVLLHAAAIAASLHILVHGWTEKDMEVSNRFRVKSVSMNPVLSGTRAPQPPARRFAEISRAEEAEKKPEVRDVPVRPTAAPTPLAQNAVEIAPKAVDLDDSSVPRPELEALLRKTEERELKEKVQSRQRSTAEVEKRAASRLEEAHRFDADRLVKALARPLEGLTAHSPENLKVDPEEGMPGFTPTAQGKSGLFEAMRPDHRLAEKASDVVPYEALDEFLDIEVYTYADPAEKKNYYMIKIFAKKNAPLKVMPKEVLFTVDCSLSISPDRLDEFKKGITRCLKNLNEGDVFNIVAFQDRPILFSPRSLAASPEAIERAGRFIAGLVSNQRTDVNGAFADIVKMPLARVPSNVILISDGRPTHGVVDDRELLSSVSALNAKKRPIFAFSGGRKVNRYLLDFIAYQNRAWAQYIRRMPDIDTGLEEFFDKISDPVFINLRYELAGLNEDDAYPKFLPDFYRNAEFTIYGSYDREDRFSMQLLGDIEGKTKQLVFSRALSEAKRGSEDIKKGYAFNRIYHLISLLNTRADSAGLVNEIQTLSEHYGITTPYSPELEKMD
jgi:hypothetical protein